MQDISPEHRVTQDTLVLQHVLFSSICRQHTECLVTSDTAKDIAMNITALRDGTSAIWLDMSVLRTNIFACIQGLYHEDGAGRFIENVKTSTNL